MFQSTHSRGVRRAYLSMARFLPPCFNPRTHEECDSMPRRIYLISPVSIHALTRSATILMFKAHKKKLCFNPRTHEECDIKDKPYIRAAWVSIHALTRSATPIQSVSLQTKDVSIHALTRSATSGLEIQCNDGKFQSTHSRGVRLTRMEQRSLNNSFNPRTHEECDPAFAIPAFQINCFNPRTHEECDQLSPSCSLGAMFQSTHSRGVRLYHCDYYVALAGFNPRTHEECDNFFSLNHKTGTVSIHALTRSATLERTDAMWAQNVSIHALTRSATVLLLDQV